ncbi:phosphomannomutase/phosphoglucomutase [Methanolinea mesophila]|uniref:phosphoglucosamine mutase n=1 Tax=Methanolinea mesophila TaxID=547055 RepID=UPI001AEB5F74|nr:phosphoglucosamine mutase [Methanolinea mesophila]MBP1928393.1 phosphomannomutase/phosphoglucomutase [Methanolinea mesophila]
MSVTKLEKKLFGTNGVRGVTGVDMTPELALTIGMAFGSMRKGRIAIGRDTRTSGPALSSAVAAGLLATGCDVVDCGVLPTPALQFIVREKFAGGVMITASHNPPEYNGIKVIEPDGTEMGDDATVALEHRVFSRDFVLADWDGVGMEERAPRAVDDYIRAIISRFKPGIGKGITVVVDPGCGAAAWTTAKILTGLGCRVLTINALEDGTFPGRMPEPSIEGLSGLADLVRSTGAAFGVAHDGDADRAVFVDETGTYVEENREFALVERYICARSKGAVVTPVSSSLLIETVARESGCTTVYTPVGSIYVARTMIDLIAGGTPVVFGGEGNGGLIFPDHQFCRDGGMTAATMVAILAGEKRALSALVAELPPFHLIKDKRRVDDPGSLVKKVQEVFSRDRLDLTDGVRINRDLTWALVRPSGTEPLVRVLVESEDPQKAEALYKEILTLFKN